MAKLQLALTALLLYSCRSTPASLPVGGSPARQNDAGSGGGSGMTAPNRDAGGGATAPRQAGAGGVSGTRSAAGVGGVSGRAAGSGGAGSAGTSSAAGSGGAAAPAPCPGLFCEDFEDGELDTSVWTRTELSTENSAAVASDRVAHGKYAMHFHAKGGSRYSLILHEGLPEPLRKHYFGRLYYYASGFPTESGGHTAYITSSNTLDGFPDQDHHLEVASYYENSGPTWQMTYWTGDGPEYIASGGMIPVAKWFCLEWELDDEPDAIAIWVDGDSKQGASFRDINNGASGLLGGMTTLGLGFRTWHPMGAPDIDLYIDDVVLDTKRVGCLP